MKLLATLTEDELRKAVTKYLEDEFEVHDIEVTGITRQTQTTGTSYVYDVCYKIKAQKDL